MGAQDGNCPTVREASFCDLVSSLGWPLCNEFLNTPHLQANRARPFCATNVRNHNLAVALRSAMLKENHMTDEIKKDQGQNPGQSGEQSGQPQQKHEDASKKNPTQDRNQGQDDKQQQDQGGQRRASWVLIWAPA